MTRHPVVSPSAWREARVRLLEKEKEFNRLRDELSAARRELPREKVEKNYVFDGPNGKETLADLFDGRSQLVVYHFMFAPEWEGGCKSCSWWADNFERNVIHLAHRDVTMVAISRAPIDKLETLARDLGRTTLCSADFARYCGGELVAVGELPLAGFRALQPAFGLADE